jgi:hypothetical protein
LVGFSQGKIASDDRNAPGIEVGRPKDTYRRVRIDSKFGKIAVLVTDGRRQAAIISFPGGYIAERLGACNGCADAVEQNRWRRTLAAPTTGW